MDLALEPNRAELDALLRGPFVDRVIHSEPVRELQEDVEVRQLIAERRGAQVLLHPVFLRVVGHVMTELRNEAPAAPRPQSS